MKITLQRTWPLPKRTLGRVFVSDVFECFSCEDTVRLGPKVHGATAIPAGTYPVIVTRSPKFGRDLPLVCGVPGFEGVRIHPGNTEADTEGCILVGLSKDGAGVYDSKMAFARLFQKITMALASHDDVTLEVVNTAMDAVKANAA